MRGVPATMDNVVPFRRPAGPGLAGAQGLDANAVRRRDQRALMDAVYASGTLPVAAGDRDTKLIAARLQVYGFLAVEEMTGEGEFRRLRPSEAIRARGGPWRLSKSSTGAGLPVTIPLAEGFLFEQPA